MNKNYICHWGIKGQKWGIRRYQNEDGTLTPEGKAKYGTADNLKVQVKGNNRIKAGLIGLTASTALAAVPVAIMGIGKATCNEKLVDIGAHGLFWKPAVIASGLAAFTSLELISIGTKGKSRSALLTKIKKESGGN